MSTYGDADHRFTTVEEHILTMKKKGGADHGSARVCCVRSLLPRGPNDISDLGKHSEGAEKNSRVEFSSAEAGS
jgi:hypothetical protein